MMLTFSPLTVSLLHPRHPVAVQYTHISIALLPKFMGICWRIRATPGCQVHNRYLKIIAFDAFSTLSKQFSLGARMLVCLQALN